MGEAFQVGGGWVGGVPAALVGALGVLWKRTALEGGAGIMGLGFLAVAVLLLIKPERFLMP